MAGGTFLALVGLDFALAPLTPISRPLITEGFFPEKAATGPTVVRVEDLIDENTPLLGRLLTTKERQIIRAELNLPPDFQGELVAGPGIPMIILHDTAGELSREELENRPIYQKTPLGDGIAAYVPREGEVIFTRSVLFTAYRPTATAYERGFDLGSEEERNQAMVKVWQKADNATRQQALQKVISQLDDPPGDLANRANLWFTLGDQGFRREFTRSPRRLDGGKSIAIWAIAALCEQASADNAKNPNSNGSTELFQACKDIHPQLQASQQRLASSFNVELVQKEGSDCFTSTGDVQAYNRIADPAHRIASGQVEPLATYYRPAYTDSQYTELVKIYLQGAITAGRFPKIVTHYWLDQGNGGVIGSHCDPRGLDINRLYQEIALTLNHPADNLYGPLPKYGLDPAVGDNVWWSEEIMNSPPPIAN